MVKKKAREDEAEEAAAAAGLKESAATKRRRTTGASGIAPSGMCDDVLRSIFARVPANTAVASMVLSKHHHRLMLCPDFVALHCLLAPPLPHPHVVYLATAKVRRSHALVSGYHGFHVAGGLAGNAPMRALAGPMYLGKRCVNRCNGILLLADKPRHTSTTCVLWNPAIADEKQVTFPVCARARDDCEILGLGYVPRTKTYKLLLTRRREDDRDVERVPHRIQKELLVYALGGAGAGAGEERRLLSCRGLDGEISGESLYMDGTIYLLHLEALVILAFDVDDETVTTINLPGQRQPHWGRGAISKLSVMSGRPCVDVEDDHCRALWLLTGEHKWEMRCIMEGYHQYVGDILSLEKHRIHHYSTAGVWDCGGVLVMYLRRDERDDKLFLYCNATKKLTATKKLIEKDLPASMTPDRSEYALCWGYKPTLVSPGSVVSELEQDEERRRDRAADIMAALVSERDRRAGQEATLETVCFMEFLLRIMRKLPDNLQDVTAICESRRFRSHFRE